MKFLRFLLYSFLTVFLLVLVLAFDLKLLLQSPDRYINFAREKNVYAYIATEVVGNIEAQTNDKSAADVKFIESVKKTVTPANIQTVIEDIANQIFLIIHDKSVEPKLTIRFSGLQEQARAELAKEVGDDSASAEIMNKFPNDQEINLGGYLGIKILRNLSTIILVAGIASIVLISLLLLCGWYATGMIWIGWAFIVTGLVTLLEFLIYASGLLNGSIQKITDAAEIKDQNFVQILKDFISEIVQIEKPYYMKVSISLLVLGLTLLILGYFLGGRKKAGHAPPTSQAPQSVQPPQPTPMTKPLK